jgi:hypothetical protein
MCRISTRRILVKIVTSVLFFLVLLEVAFQVLALVRPLTFYLNGDIFTFEQRFLDRYENDQFIYKGLHVPHETRGWTSKPDVAIVDEEGRRFTTNNLGHRSLSDHATDPDRFPVVIIGDSFTFGIDADDAGVWPTLLASREPRLNLANLGVGGYGMDQMYVTLRETIGRYRPKLVVVAFIGDDLARSLQSFLDFKKPRFVLDEDGTLTLTNVPIGGIDEIYAEVSDRVSRRRLWQWVKTAMFVRKVADRVTGQRDHVPLNTAIVERMLALCERHGAEVLFVHLAHDEALRDGGLHDQGEAFIETFAQTHTLHHLLTRPAFLAAGEDWGVGHYRAKEATLVSRLVHEKIITLPSWRAFEAAQASPE